jgi:hypothetical protein
VKPGVTRSSVDTNTKSVPNYSECCDRAEARATASETREGDEWNDLVIFVLLKVLLVAEII